MGRERNKDAWVCLLIFHVDRGNKPKFGAVRGETKAVAEAGLQLPLLSLIWRTQKHMARRFQGCRCLRCIPRGMRPAHNRRRRSLRHYR